MAAALLTAIFASITGIVAAMYLGYQSASTGGLAQHISIGIFSTMITLLAHSMMMFYFLGKAKAVREAAAEGGLSREFERRIAVGSSAAASGWRKRSISSRWESAKPSLSSLTKLRPWTEPSPYSSGTAR